MIFYTFGLNPIYFRFWLRVIIFHTSRRSVQINGVTTSVEAFMFDAEDIEKISTMYTYWRDLSKLLKDFKSRAINLPEGLSESAFCICFDIKNCGRVTKIERGSVSFDVINFRTGKRIQVKACSINNDLTSFGPTSVWDDFYFMDFYKDGSFNGSFDIYLIPDELVYNTIVNTRKNETFKDQQLQGRRPRLSVKKIIKNNNIDILKTCNLIV